MSNAISPKKSRAMGKESYSKLCGCNDQTKPVFKKGGAVKAPAKSAKKGCK